MIINNNEFKGQTVFIQIVNTYNFNTTPAVIPETVPKKDTTVILIDKVMPILYSFLKWVFKFIPLIIPLHSG